jgi:Cu-Zn family superoxide dismutase
MALTLATGLVGCSSMTSGPTARRAQTHARQRDGGHGDVQQQADRVALRRVEGLKPGRNTGFIHEKGDCSSGDGMSTAATSIRRADRTARTTAPSAMPVTCRR